MSRTPPVPHPLDIALREAFARRMGLDPAELSDWLEWRKPTPREWRDRLVAALFPAVPPESFWVEGEEALTPRGDAATLATGEQVQISREGKISRAQLNAENREHPFVKALVAKGMSVTEISSTLGYPRSTVQSWYHAKKENRRPIPRAAAEAIRKRLGVPMSTWTDITD